MLSPGMCWSGEDKKDVIISAALVNNIIFQFY